MSNMNRFAFILAALACGVAASAQQAAPKPTTVTPPPMTMKEAKQKLGIVVFPAKGQAPKQQEADELACLQWAADQIGLNFQDPNAAAANAKAQAANATAGAGVAGAAKGAAAGAIIGSISGNAGPGAGYGAAAGAIAGRQKKKKAEAQAEAQGAAQADAANKAKRDQLAKAMSMCLDSKGYKVQ
jgi:hypothetical protein